MNPAPDTTVPAGITTRPSNGWSASDLPCAPGTVLQFRTLQGARVIAVLTDHSLWRVQSVSTRGEVLQWSWTPAALAGNLWEAERYEVIPAP
ncbi:MAG TPA: hypothetical protein VF885_12845 [Arthrobacter sp.]